MDYQTLNSWRGIEKEIRILENLINTKTGMITACDNVHREDCDAAGRRERLTREIEDHLNALGKCEAMRHKIEDFVVGVTDTDVRIAMRLHFLMGWTWVKTGMHLDLDESAIRKKVKAYLDLFGAADN